MVTRTFFYAHNYSSLVKHTKQLDLRETLKTKMSEGILVTDYVWKMIYHLNTLKILVAQISGMSQ